MSRAVKVNTPDMILLDLAITLVVIGVLLVFDASYPTCGDSKNWGYDMWYFAKRQMIYAGAGFLFMLLVSIVPIDLVRKCSIIFLLGSIALLVCVLLFGVTINGSKSWLRIGTIPFQPSEFAKLAVVVYMARVLGKPNIFARGRERRWLAAVFWTGLIFLLVVAQRDLGTAVVLFCIMVTMFIIAGAKKRYIGLVVACGLVTVLGTMKYLPHCRARVEASKNPWAHYYHAGYQVVHSLIGFGTGGLTGLGLGEGRVKCYIPAAYTDYIFVTVAEETGLVGSLVLVGLFAAFTVRAFRVARDSESLYGALIASGIGSAISIQALINMAVATNSIPATGLPLPFISYGGSSLLTTLIGVGLILSVSRESGVEVCGEDIDEGDSYRRGDRWSRVSRGGSSGSTARIRSKRRTVLHR
ncbi:MAG: FtsW/RodA/SpoVE family cell cycle protein [Armatimonadota bacterium]